MLKKKSAEKITTHLCGIYEIMWKNMVEPDMPQLKIPHGHFACLITETRKQTHMHNI
jgi:hypothetical protein